ncbi:asparagine synthase [Clostridium ganghwense]|uniref:Asparagine synthase n=1 Tax=Clostridium ganghwense TaxID=312089 RepID=A0ABT4CL64_9CLOT|nr:asparagine synthase [Clostridium ganghwense]MCY6369780.1 asparagine synthase [Clostridium ganghwense]
MRIREGMIPTVLGTVVTGAGTALTRTKVNSKIAAGIVGFGLAHVVLGSIDLVQHNRKIW